MPLYKACHEQNASGDDFAGFRRGEAHFRVGGYWKHSINKYFYQIRLIVLCHKWTKMSLKEYFYLPPTFAWCKLLNTQNMTNPTIVSPVKMEYGWNFSISGQKMMVKSGLEKIFLKFLHALTMSFLFLNLYFWPKLLLSMK